VQFHEVHLFGAARCRPPFDLRERQSHWQRCHWDGLGWDQADFDAVGAGLEHNRYLRRRGPGSKRSDRAARHNNHSRFAAHRICQTIVMIIRPAVSDCDIAALNAGNSPSAPLLAIFVMRPVGLSAKLIF
jgi:hypothetical protein